MTPEVGLNVPPSVTRWGAGPQLGLVLPSPALGGLGGRADGGEAGAGVPGLLSRRGGCSARHRTGLALGKTSKDGGLAGLGRHVYGRPVWDGGGEGVLWGTLGSSSLFLASLEPWSRRSKATRLGKGPTVQRPQSLGYKMASEPTPAAPPGYGCQRYLPRKQSVLLVSLLPVTPGGGRARPGGLSVQTRPVGLTWPNASPVE